MKVSEFADKIARTSGIGQLMDDIGYAQTSSGDIIMLGGGNPAHIPQVDNCLRRNMKSLMQRGFDFEKALGGYSAPQGDIDFIDALCSLLNKEYSWGIDTENIVLTNGSQTAFFILFNLFAGRFRDGLERKILLPMTPEYIGYSDLGLTKNMFISCRPRISQIDDVFYKYHVDFDALKIDDTVNAVCVSRPTNPTGNVLTDTEINKLNLMATEKGIPLIIDNAYGTPFPNIIFTDAKPLWNDNTIVCMSLSKFGLPGVRTGIVIANKEIVRMVSHANAVMSLAPGGLGAAVVTEMLRDKSILNLSRQCIMPFYQKKAERAVGLLADYLHGIDFRIHKPEGAFFLWLWLKNLPISCELFYERLKKRGVLVIPGHHFFPGLDDDWRHRYECIRISYAPDDDIVSRGIKIIADEARRAYAES